jgi:hypothetical protein
MSEPNEKTVDLLWETLCLVGDTPNRHERAGGPPHRILWASSVGQLRTFLHTTFKAARVQLARIRNESSLALGSSARVKYDLRHQFHTKEIKLLTNRLFHSDPASSRAVAPQAATRSGP